MVREPDAHDVSCAEFLPEGVVEFESLKEVRSYIEQYFWNYERIASHEQAKMLSYKEIIKCNANGEYC